MTDGDKTYTSSPASAHDAESELDELIAEIHDNAATSQHAGTSLAKDTGFDAFEESSREHVASGSVHRADNAAADAAPTIERARAGVSLQAVNACAPDPFDAGSAEAAGLAEVAAHILVDTPPVVDMPTGATRAVCAADADSTAASTPVDTQSDIALLDEQDDMPAAPETAAFHNAANPHDPAALGTEMPQFLQQQEISSDSHTGASIDPLDDTGELSFEIDANGHARAASPEDTAEIDPAEVEAKLSDPGSTQSFAPIAEERIDTSSTFDAGTTTSLMWGARSDVGCVRSHNEDSYLAASPLFAVCDGMGGHAAGEVASSIAVETIAKMAPSTADATALAAAVEAANAAVIEAAVNGIGRPGMGCTATCAYIEGNTVAIAHVGDSRAYLLHDNTLIRITRDHSYVEELVDAGEITADEARVHPNRSVITRALGSDPAMYADHFTLNIQEGDRLILCSDGLSSMIGDGEIEEIASKSSTAQMCTDNLVDAALAAGGGDNVSVVVVDVVDDGRLKEIAQRRKRNLIIALSLLAAAVLLAIVTIFFSVTHSVYLGVKDDMVAIYRGVPGDFLGMQLHWLEDETAIELNNLPEDTQNRLREGIPQTGLDEAADTVNSYRKQIDAQKTESAQNAQTIDAAKALAAESPADPAQPQPNPGQKDAPAPDSQPEPTNTQGGA